MSTYYSLPEERIDDFATEVLLVCPADRCLTRLSMSVLRPMKYQSAESSAGRNLYAPYCRVVHVRADWNIGVQLDEREGECVAHGV